MNKTYLDIAAPGIAGLRPYVPGKPISELERELGVTGSIKMASNENPLGPSPKALAAAQAALGELARYPDGGGFELRRALAAKHGVDMACITLGNGSNDVLDMIARVFLHPCVETVMSEYAFAVYPICSQAVGATIRIAPARAYGHDLDAMRERVNEHTRVVWVANPNNPTGTWLAREPLHAFIASLPEHVIAVVDEAYVEYVDEPYYPDASQWLDDFPNLIVTRTFSKAYGLAALRVGYALSGPDIADLLNRVRQPFNVNSVALAAAQAALDDEDHVRRGIQLTRQGMAQLVGGVRARGLSYVPSVCNFLTIDLGQPAGPIDQALLREGVITRPIANYGLPSHLRVTVGLPEENARFLAALKKVLGR